MRIRRAPQLERAFTLIEVTVSMAIIGILFVSLFSGVGYGFSLVNLARENLRANQIIVEKMETIRLYNWDQINSNGFIPLTFTADFFPPVVTNIVSAPGSGDGAASTAVVEGKGITYYGRITLTNAPVADAYKTNMKMVTVTLTWTNKNTPRTRELTTLVSKNGLQDYVYY